MTIRFAAESDASALLAIYAQYLNTPITFEYDQPGIVEFTRRVADISAAYPYIVCEEDGRIAGYAYAHRNKEREAYQWDAELSVYIDRGHVSRGYGRQLYITLMELLRMQGVRTVYAGVTLPNAASERLHDSMGFTHIGVGHSTGYKCGAWWDVLWYEKQLLPYDAAPAPVIPVHELPQCEVAAVFGRCGG